MNGIEQLQLKLYNTETKQKESISPADGKDVRLYTCGPTVYNYAHIGNFRTYVFEDLLRRSLKFFSMRVKQVMNITDIDDKTIKGAIEKKVSLESFTEPYKKAFFEDLQALSIEPAEYYPCATSFIPEMIEMISSLLEKEVAYKSKEGDVYFSIEKFSLYGRLSHLKLEELKQGASERVGREDEYEKDKAADFVLWKSFDPKRDGEIYWESPFGKGRPGWHLECSAMAISLLGADIDIHCGGVDNIFPHHENEIAQSEAYLGKRFVRHWVHSAHLLVENKKMAKSSGNFYTLRDLLKKGYTGKELRYLFFQTHYRVPLNFTFASLEGARVSLQRLQSLILRLSSIEKERPSIVEPLLEKALYQFSEAMADDLNSSSALSIIFTLVREIHKLCDEDRLGKEDGEKVVALFKKMDEVLAIFPLENEEEKIPKELEEMLEKREVARKEKNWSLADELRQTIYQAGYEIEDGKERARLKKRL